MKTFSSYFDRPWIIRWFKTAVVVHDERIYSIQFTCQLQEEESYNISKKTTTNKMGRQTINIQEEEDLALEVKKVLFSL